MAKPVSNVLICLSNNSNRAELDHYAEYEDCH